MRDFTFNLSLAAIICLKLFSSSPNHDFQDDQKCLSSQIRDMLKTKTKVIKSTKKINEEVSMTTRNPYPQEHEIGLPLNKMVVK